MEFQYENSCQVKDKISQYKTAILPVGAVEAHGPHLPLGTDNILAERLANKLAKEINAFILPTLPYGQVWSLKNFPGSIHIKNSSLINIIVDIGESVSKQGFKKFIMVNGHLGNQTALKEAARILYDSDPSLRVFYFFYPEMNQAAAKVRDTERTHHTYFHACEIETSFMLYLAPEYVMKQEMITDIPDIPIFSDFTPTPWEEFTQSAVLGDSTLATKGKGEYIIETALKNMVQIIHQFAQE